jgi:hypothetical protein
MCGGTMQELTHLINGDDYSHIQEAFNEVICYSQNVPESNTDLLFAQWYNNKKWIRECLGGKLIYTLPTPVQFSLGEEQKKRMLEEFIDFVGIRNHRLSYFLDVTFDDFFDNKLSHNYYFEDDLTLKAGSKLIKSFKYFESDPIMLRAYQDRASQLIQENKIEGQLCISIHPLDYLSVSENNANWRSCHALDGEYRAGNLNYMADNCTAICYLRSPEDEVLGSFPDSIKWNSKKWRMLLFFSQDKRMLFASRQYPFHTDVGLKIILDQLLPESGLLKEEEPTNSFRKTHWAPWSNKRIGDICLEDGTTIVYGDMIPLGKEIISIHELIKTCSAPLFFNDLTQSSSYTPLYTYKIRNEFGWKSVITVPEQTRFKIGENIKCLCCEKKDAVLSDSVYCIDCDLKYGHSENDDIFTYCDRCGARITFEEAVTVGDDGENWCQDCFSEYGRECKACGGFYDISEFILDDDDDEICRWCRIDIEEESLWHEETMLNNR